MNVNYQTSKAVQAAARIVALLALPLVTSGLQAQTANITPIVAPGTPFSVTALNGSGQVSGNFFVSESEQRAFLWGNGAALDLGTLGGSQSLGSALNNAGQVAGFAFTAGDGEFHAFASVGNNLSDLGTLGGAYSSANGLNDAGTVVGQSDLASSSSGYRAFRMASGGQMQDLGTLGGSYSSACKINSVGHVVGHSTLADDSTHAFRYTGGGLQDLGTLGGSFSMPCALNESGHVTGESGTASGEIHAFLFDGTALVDLGTLGGTISRGIDIDNAGRVIGNSMILGDQDFRGFIHSNGALQDLGTLGGTGSTARDINNHGQVVGTSTDVGGLPRAYLWENGTMTDLNTLLPANSGWDLTDAHFINDSRQIVVRGTDDQLQDAWFLLSLGGNENQPPVANAGPDQSFACGVAEALVTLDGSASSDPDGDALTHEWFAGNVSIGTSASLSVTLSAGSYAFTLRVTDTAGATSDDSVAVDVGLDTIPPVVECPAARTLPAGEKGRALIPNLLEGLAASDNCSAASALVKQQSPAAGTVVRCGAHIVTLTVVDAAGNHTTCSTTISVVDVTSPVVNCPEEIFRRARTNCQAAVPDLSWRLGASDNCTPRKELVITQDPAPGTLVGVGRHEVRFTVADAAGNKTTCSTVLNVFDWTRPVFSSLTASPNVLRPADGRMVRVTLAAEVKDNCDPNPVCRIIWVTSNEHSPDSDDNTGRDWRITGDLSLELRAELTSRRGARVYTILVACTDASGNTTLRTTHVRVTRN